MVIGEQFFYINNRIINANGIAVGARIYFYLSGTTTLQPIYEDPDLTTPLANPYTVNAGAAIPNIYLVPTIVYRVRVVALSGEVINDFDPYTPLISQSDLDRVIGYVTPEQYGAAGDGIEDDTAAVQAAINTGRSVYFAGTYVCSALSSSADGVTFFGPGTIEKKADVDGRLLQVTHDNVSIIGLTFDGSAAAPTPGSGNDLIRFQGANDGLVENCFVNGSQGNGIRFDGSARSRAVNNIVLDCYQNNILVCNPGSDGCLVRGNICQGTSAQNNIYVTASDGGVGPPGDFIYDIVVTDNECDGGFDTCIEIGWHTIGAVVSGNRLKNSMNAAILLRDCRNVTVVGNNIRSRPFADQPSNYVALAVIPLDEGSSWEYRSLIGPNLVMGAAKLAAVYVDGAHITVDGVKVYDDETAVNASGSNLQGTGIAALGNDVTVRNCTIGRFEFGIQLNVGEVSPPTRTNVDISENTIYECKYGVIMFDMIVVSSVVKNNRFRKMVNAALSVDSTTYAGQLRYFGNDVWLEGFSGATPTELSPAYAGRFGLLTSPSAQYLLIPENTSSETVIASSDVTGAGTLTIKFMDESELAIFACGGRPSVGTGTTLKTIGTTNLLPSADSGGASGWSLYFNGSNALALKRCGSNTGSPARYMVADWARTGNF